MRDGIVGALIGFGLGFSLGLMVMVRFVKYRISLVVNRLKDGEAVNLGDLVLHRKEIERSNAGMN